jgi:hypothetical protein
MDAFVENSAISMPPDHLYRMAALLYAETVRPALGDGAPEWPTEAIRSHYEHCRLSERMRLITQCRQLRAIREMLLMSIKRAAARGVESPETQALQNRVSVLETKLLVRLQSRPLPSAPHRSAPRAVGRAAALASVTGAAEGSLAPRAVEAAVVDDASSDASAADTVRAICTYDGATAQQALHDILYEAIEPCVPPSTSAQPTLLELRARAGAPDVMARDRLEQQRGFQEARPPMGRRCFCRGRRAGEACSVQLDGAFLEQLVGERGGLRDFYKRDPTVLRDAILSLLQLHKGPIRTRGGYGANTVFGFRKKMPRK